MIYGTVVASFFVDGKPVPQGSKNLGRNGKMYESAKGLYAWRKHVSDVAKKQYDGEPLDGPMLLRCTFIMYRPVATPKRKTTPPAVKKPDCSKLVRAVEDSLTKVIWVDDSQVTRIEADKRIAEIGEPMGVYISVIALAVGSETEMPEAA